MDWKRKLLEKEILLQTATISKREQELRDLSNEGDGFTETTQYNRLVRDNEELKCTLAGIQIRYDHLELYGHDNRGSEDCAEKLSSLEISNRY
jgi:hypothetical protein